MRDARIEVDAYFDANGQRPLAECKEEILGLMSMIADKGYREGGREMEEGIQNSNPHVRWR